jgi:hypothetical protein
VRVPTVPIEALAQRIEIPLVGRQSIAAVGNGGALVACNRWRGPGPNACFLFRERGAWRLRDTREVDADPVHGAAAISTGRLCLGDSGSKRALVMREAHGTWVDSLSFELDETPRSFRLDGDSLLACTARRRIQGVG